MIGILEQGEIKTRCEVAACEGGFKGRLSLPGFGTQFTSVYPDKTDAIAALVDLRRDAFGPNVSEAALPPITQ